MASVYFLMRARFQPESWVEKVKKEEAMEVAVEMYGYCPDVDQSYDTLGLLAGSLVDSSVWYLWWD